MGKKLDAFFKTLGGALEAFGKRRTKTGVMYWVLVALVVLGVLLDRVVQWLL